VIGANPQRRFSTPGLGYRAPLADGDQGTAQTIAMMRRLVDDALNDSTFVRQAMEIVRTTAPFDDMGEAKAIYDWVRGHIRYTKDPTTKEKLYPPQELLKTRAGDCDDTSMLIAALLMAVGYPARWVTIAASPDSPQEFTHIFAEAEIPPGSGNWLSLDTARIDAQFGIEPPVYFRKRAWYVADNHYEDLSGSARRPRFLSGYTGLGQDDINWQPVVQQSIAEIPTIIAATSGHGAASSPYGSYQSPYTPGYGIAPAGYTAPYGTTMTGAGLSMSPTMLLLIAAGVLLFLHARK
jgi:hypothetical protein